MRSLSKVALIAIASVIAGCTEKIIEAPALPNAPTALQAALVPPKSVRLTWTAADPASSYSVYRNNLKMGDATSPEFTDSTVASNTTYTWFVVARASDGRVSAPSEPVTVGFGDITAPTVVNTTPATSATGVSRLPSPSVTFSENMIPLSLSGGIVATVTATGEEIYGTVKYDPATRTADFWPLAILPARTAITLRVTNTPRDVAGNPVAPFSFSFTTGDTPGNIAELPPSNEPLLVSSPIGGDFGPRELFKMRADGTGRINITNNNGSDLSGAWSPDGRHVAFTSDRNGTFDVYVMREDGMGVRQLTFDAKDQTQPSWSRDARRIVFVSTRDGVPPTTRNSTPGDIWTMNADGSAQMNLSATPGVYEAWPQWSPDSQRLLYKRTELGVNSNGDSFRVSNQFMTANADGTGAKPLKTTDPRFDDDAPAWSPDGTQIAFSAFNFNHPPFNENYLLFLINADGTNLRQLTTGGSQRRPAWSPDGGSLVFSVSGFDEFWGRFGKIGAATMNISTRTLTTIAPQTPPSEVMSAQSWRR